MFYEQRFGDDGSSTTRSEQAGNRYDKVYEKNGEMTYHRFIVTKTLQLTRLGNLTNLCQELGIRTQHVCKWLDSTGGSGLSNGILGYAEKSKDELAFVFGDDAGRFHTTFSYDRAKDEWSWTMDSEKEGQFKPFARLTMRRQ